MWSPLRFWRFRVDGDIAAYPPIFNASRATTEADARNVRTGAEAVGDTRSRIPSRRPYVVTVRPNAATSIQTGTVAPAFGQPGGGVEVVFPAGTQPATVTGPTKLPDQ